VESGWENGKGFWKRKEALGNFWVLGIGEEDRKGGKTRGSSLISAVL
jgi:hypothetical protein